MSFLVAPLLALFVAPPQGYPQEKTPEEVGIGYDILVCRMPADPGDPEPLVPDAANFSLLVGRGTQLVLVRPDGTEDLLYDPGPVAACADPFLSFDGRVLYFTLFEDPENLDEETGLPASPAHIWKLELDTRELTPLTTGQEVRYGDTRHGVAPSYAQLNVAPIELPDGRLMFLSNLDGAHGAYHANGLWWPAMKFWRMTADGSNLEALERFSMGGSQSPMILTDGRVIWTHYHPAGRRQTGGGNYPLFEADQDMRRVGTFAGAHFIGTAWHFTTQLSDGDVVTTAYYHHNNFGHGTLLRFPADPGHASGNAFTPAASDPDPEQANVYGVNDHFNRVGERLVTPWSLGWDTPSLGYDTGSRFLNDGTLAGKSTMPAGIPGGHMLFVWSSGFVNRLQRPIAEAPHMKLCYAQDGMVANRNDLIILKQSDSWHYLYPKAVVPYRDIYGQEKPDLRLSEDQSSTLPVLLPEGTPFATTGTSSVLNRESAWPEAFLDEWDADSARSYGQIMAYNRVGQDTCFFDDQEVYAVQVVADMEHVDTRAKRNLPGFRSHNLGTQIWGILGEVPVENLDEFGQPIFDSMGNLDTSFEARIPANVPYHHRLIDKDGITLTGEYTWLNARPGERKTHCGGCHAHSTDVIHLPFDDAVANQPNYPREDLALQTPLVGQDDQGQPFLTYHQEKIRVVEFYRDVKPIFEAKCNSCHSGSQAAAGLDLADPDAVTHLAFHDESLWAYHQATRYVRKNSAAQSLLAWKVYGRRLDRRDNADRPDDVDFTGTIMPPPNSGQDPLTFEEKRTIANWIDLGCLTDMTPGTEAMGDPFDDQMKPTLLLSGVRPGDQTLPVPPLRIGVYDLHSGIQADSLKVFLIDSDGQSSSDLASGMQVADGDVVSLSLPATRNNRWHVIQAQVLDQAGNRAIQELRFRPVDPPILSQGPFVLGQSTFLKVVNAQPGRRVDFLLSFQGMGVGSSHTRYGHQRLGLLEPVQWIGSRYTDAAGMAEYQLIVPPGFQTGTVWTQAMVVSGPSGEDSISTQVLESQILP
ncbi:MAG: hypothetical protein DWQ01_14565 [Planctomycetota bacterium]|nr:MAG: hypothetical protein DWQ01_14565 [Planctomycetota bacterium]